MHALAACPPEHILLSPAIFLEMSKLYVSFAEYNLFYRSLLHKRPKIVRSLLVFSRNAAGDNKIPITIQNIIEMQEQAQCRYSYQTLQ